MYWIQGGENTALKSLHEQSGWTGEIHYPSPHAYKLRAWAACQGLRETVHQQATCCLHWLMAAKRRKHDTCTREPWMVDTTAWVQDRAPAVLLSQPRRLYDEHWTLLAGLAAREDVIVKVYDGGWIEGDTTTSIEVWSMIAYATVRALRDMPPQWI